VLVDCGICEARVDGETKGSLEYFLEDNPVPERVTLLKCPSCGGPILVGQEIVGSRSGRDILENPYRKYPPRDRPLDTSVPRRIRETFAEAQVCFRAKAFMASAVMCRKALEGIAHSQGAKARTLDGSLKALKTNGIIDHRLDEWPTHFE